MIVPPTGVDGHSEEVIPDITANYIWNFSGGHLNFGAIGGQHMVNPDVRSDSSGPPCGL